MAPKDSECKYWSRMAQRFDDATRFIVGSETQLALQAWLHEHIEAGDSVLELGCGTGQYSEVIAREARTLVATDGSVEMLDVARRKLEPFANVTVRELDCYQVDFPAGVFDAVFVGNLLHIVSEPDRVLAESRHVLRPGGRLIAIDSTASGMPWWGKLEMVLRYLLAFGPPPSTNRNMRPEDAATMVHDAGFRVEDLVLVGRETRAICLTGRKP